MRLPDEEDCSTTGKAIGLTKEQIGELSKLPTGAAVIYQNNWIEAVLTQIDKCPRRFYQDDVISANSQIASAIGKVSLCMITQYEENHKHLQLDEIRDIIQSVDLSIHKKQEIMSGIAVIYDALESEMSASNRTFCKLLYNFIGCDGLFKAIPLELKQPYANDYDEIPNEDIYASREWYAEIVSRLEHYAYIPEEELRHKLLQYLMFHVTMKYESDRRYDIAYYSIFRS